MIVFPIGLLALHIPSPQSVEGSWRLLAFSFWWHTLEKKMGPYFNFIGSFWDPFSTVTSFPTPPSYITPFSDSGALLSFVPIFDDFSFFSLEIEIGSLSLSVVSHWFRILIQIHYPLISRKSRPVEMKSRVPLVIREIYSSLSLRSRSLKNWHFQTSVVASAFDCL